MSEARTPLSILRANKTAFIAIAVVLFLLELAIFAVAALRSGESYKLQLIDRSGNLIYETDGKNLSDFDKYHFERTHGLLQNYQKKLQKTHTTFPFRAWFVSAVGIPLGVILCFVFILKAYTALFYGDQEKEEEPDSEKIRYETGLEKILGRVNRFNIFVIASLVFLAILSYWIVPNLLTYLGNVGIETLMRFRWVILLVGLAGLGILVWIIYLKYLLARKTVESQVEVDKYRMELEYKRGLESTPQLEHHPSEKPAGRLVARDADQVIDAARDE